MINDIQKILKIINFRLAKNWMKPKMTEKRIKTINPKEGGFSNPPKQKTKRRGDPVWSPNQHRTNPENEQKHSNPNQLCRKVCCSAGVPPAVSPASRWLNLFLPLCFCSYYHATYNTTSYAHTHARLVGARGRESVKKYDFSKTINLRNYHEIKELQKLGRSKKITLPKIRTNPKMTEKQPNVGVDLPVLVHHSKIFPIIPRPDMYNLLVREI